MSEWEIARLTAEIEAVNKANRIANEIRPLLLDYFKPLIGKKVRKQDGTLTKRVEEELPQFANQPGVSIRFEGYSRSMYWRVNVHVKYKHFDDEFRNEHAGQSVLVGANDDDGVLTEVVTIQPALKCDYKLEDVFALIKAAREARDFASKAMGACHPFTRSV